MGAKDKLIKGALNAFATKAPTDPLAAVVAARMTGQLEAMSPLMGLKASMNLPAAYAGDQRSLQPVLRNLQENENLAQGLPASPGRRKVLKQGAATAARSLLPDGGVVAKALMDSPVSMVEKAVAPEIPVESIQAAIAQALDKALSNKAFIRTINDFGGPMEDLVDNEDLGPKALAQINKIHDSLLPENIAKASGLPVEVIQKHLTDVKTNPLEVLDEWIMSNNSMDNFYDETPEDQFIGYSFDELPDTPEHNALVEKLRSIDDTDGEAMDLAISKVYDSYWDHHAKKNLGFYSDLLGKNFHTLADKYGPTIGDPRAHFNEMQNTLIDMGYPENLFD